MSIRQIIFLDTETTGFQRFDRIISLAAIRSTVGCDDADILYRCFDPRKDSHPGAISVHGWDNWTTRFQDLFADHAVELHEWLSCADLLVMHNAEFDLHFVNREFRKCGLPPVSAPNYCTLKQARMTWSGSVTLDACVQRLGLRRAGAAHHPVEDAFFTWNLYRHFNGYRPLQPPERWPHPENYRLVDARPPGDLPRRSIKKPGGYSRGWSQTQRGQLDVLTRPVAIILNFLALSDNNFAAEEKAVIRQLVQLAAARLTLPASARDIDASTAELAALAPTVELVVRAVDLALADEVWRQHLPKLMMAMVMADGNFVSHERTALAIIKDTIVNSAAR